MTATDVYDFEGNIPDMIAVAFIAAQMAVVTLNLPPNDQKPRPRSELSFKPSGASSPTRIMALPSKPPATARVVAAYSGELTIDSITAADKDSNQVHRAYRARIRQLMELDTLRNAVNISSFPYTIDFVTPTGSSLIDKTSDGYQTSSLTYHLQFSIKQDAFNQLAAAT